jgi:hypothetical protein
MVEYTDEFLDSLRLEGDPLADDVITELAASGQIGAVNALLEHLQTNDQPIPAALPPVVQEYLRITDNPPAWVDYGRIRRAHAFFMDDGPSISLVLSTAALVESYAAQRAVRVLGLTHNLEYPQRRVAETAQFCLYMMGEHGFEAGGQFIPAVQKVRLIHAAVRHFIKKSGRWPRAELGEPICQEDLLGALLMFSTKVLHGLARLGCPATSQEAEDYYYVWRVVGEMLGVRPDVIPPSPAESEALVAAMQRRHYGPSPEGVRLTRALLQMYDHLMPGEVFDGAIPAVVRFVVGDEVADWMEVPRSHWDWAVRGLPALGRVWEGAEDNSTLLRQVLDKAGWALIQAQFRVLNGGQKCVYDIPADLRAAWGIDAPPRGE